MPKKAGDGKRVILSGGEFDYEGPPDSVWVSYESKIGRKLSSELRDALTVSTMLFAAGGYGKSATTKTLISSIDLWKRRTETLRNQLSSPAAKKVEPQVLTRRAFREQFDLRKLKKPLNYNEPLSFFRFVLDAALAAAAITLKEISSPEYPGAHEVEMWSAWVALLILTLQNEKIPVRKTYSSGQHRIKPAFIDFVEAMQKTLPEKLRRRRTKDSLKKGIQDVANLVVDADFDSLLTLLFGWSVLRRPSFHKGFIRALGNDPFGRELKSVVERYGRPASERRKTGNNIGQKIN